MTINVLLVDDSAVIRGLMAKALGEDPQLHIVGTAANGSMAIHMAGEFKPDIIILDIEMPVMDGITALPEILRISPNSRIIMASTLTERNAAISMKALELGATDCIPKPSSKTGDEAKLFYIELIGMIKAISRKVQAAPVAAPAPKAPVVLAAQPAATILPGNIKALAIASSTGGPQALLSVFAQVKGHLRGIPIFITQHMPPTFTTILAEHLSRDSGRVCHEAKEGDLVKAGDAYLAPGDYHMVAQKDPVGVVKIHLNQNDRENYCRPAADPMLRSLSETYGNHLLVLVLTGMGQDGLEGSKIVAAHGGTIIAQDEASCVVYGMPKAVVENQLCKAVLPLPEIGAYLIKQIGGA